MSVQTEIDRIITAVGAAYDAVEAKGGTAPAAQTIEGIAGAISGIKSAPTTPYMVVAEYEQEPVTAYESASYIKKQSSTTTQELQRLSLSAKPTCKSWICQIHQTTLQRLKRTLLLALCVRMLSYRKR